MPGGHDAQAYIITYVRHIRAISCSKPSSASSSNSLIANILTMDYNSAAEMVAEEGVTTSELYEVFKNQVQVQGS